MKVLQRLEEHGLRMKSQCAFLQHSVEYLAHQVDAHGLHTVPSKFVAIIQAPEPKNVQQLRSLLEELLNYYGNSSQT